MDNGKAEKLENFTKNPGENWNLSAPARDLGNIGKKAIFSPEAGESAPAAEVEIVTLSEPTAVNTAHPLDFDPATIYPNGYDISPATMRTVREVIAGADSPAGLSDAYWAMNDIYNGRDAAQPNYESYIKNAGKKAA